MQEDKLTETQKTCFLLEWNDLKLRLAPDIEGNLLQSYCFADQVLGYELSQEDDPQLAIQQKKFEDLAGLNLKSDHENTTILLDIMRYCGKDVNLVEAYELFCSCHKDDLKQKYITEVTLRAWFLKALAELKYSGFVSATRQSTFLFKKNFYGKPRYSNF